MRMQNENLNGLEWTYAWTRSRSVDRYMTWRRARIYLLPPFATRGGAERSVTHDAPLIPSSPHLLNPSSPHPLISSSPPLLLPSSSCATPPYHPPRVCIYIYTRGLVVARGRLGGLRGGRGAAARAQPERRAGPQVSNRIESNRIESNRIECTVLNCTILCCAALYCTVLYCTVVYCHVMSCHVMSCNVMEWNRMYSNAL